MTIIVMIVGNELLLSFVIKGHDVSYSGNLQFVSATPDFVLRQAHTKHDLAVGLACFVPGAPGDAP